ncbi:MAG: hypothetical protein ACMXX7_03030 [Candidatus Woesearchaeota archaeon]
MKSDKERLEEICKELRHKQMVNLLRTQPTYSGLEEKEPEPHKIFIGPFHLEVPLMRRGLDQNGNIVDAPRTLISTEYLFYRALNAPEEVRNNWLNYKGVVSDGVIFGANGDFYLVPRGFDEFDLDSRVKNHGFELSKKSTSKLLDRAVYFSPQETTDINLKKGYIDINGKWNPINESVEKFWKTLTNGQDINEYLKSSEKSKGYLTNQEETLGVSLMVPSPVYPLEFEPSFEQPVMYPIEIDSSINRLYLMSIDTWNSKMGVRK